MGLNRDALRVAVAASLATDLTGQVAEIFTSLPKALKGKSPIITIENGPSRPNDNTTPDEPGQVGLIFGVWVRADDATIAENVLDTIVDAFIDSIQGNYNCTWAKNSEPAYEIDDGVLYRVEWHEVTFEWW